MSTTSTDRDRAKVKLNKLRDDATRNDYAAWAATARLILKEHELLKYIEGAESIAPIIPALVEDLISKGIDIETGATREVRVLGNQAERDKALADCGPWLHGDLVVRRLLHEAVPSHKIGLIRHTTHAKDAWETLRNFYHPANSLRAQALSTRIRTHWCRADQDVAEWVNHIRDMYCHGYTCDAQFIRVSFFYFGASYTSSRSRDSSTRSHDLHDHMICTCTHTRAPRSARTDSDITGPATPYGFRILPEPRTLLFSDLSDSRSIGL
ncbi:hypothetical protein BDW22DRAFT_1478139 [Trametopsis cervina]|nr:hypothetical protein BDW22DRAFT_1478139 [Trametopsis cervina]